MDYYESLPTKQRSQQRLSAMKTERSSWFTHWQDITTYLLPRKGRYFLTDRNRGERRNQSIIDSTGTRAHRILAAGMMAGMTSPARPWFKLQTAHPGLNDYGPVKEWLYLTEQRLRDIFSRSNTYRALHSIYGEVGGFGTASMLILPDFDDVVRCHTATIGEYYIAQNDKQIVDTFFREYEVTVGQIAAQFGLKNASQAVKNLYNRGNFDAWIPIVHAIHPRPDRDVQRMDNRNMPWASCYYEVGGDQQKLLRESGFHEFPVVAPRWETTGNDIYGSNCPGMEALGDVMQLQHEQIRKGEAIDYQTRPPLQGPSELRNNFMDLLPGGVSFVDSPGPNTGLRTAFDVNLRLDYLLNDIEDVRHRINAAFYADLFLMLANDNRSGITAREVAERHEEKMLMLGPVLERLHAELLSPLIDRTFSIALRAGLLPPAPPELAGMDLQVEYVSILAQAQRMVGVGNLDRLMATVSTLSAVKPDVLDKLNTDEMIDEYGEMLGTPPRVIHGEDEVRQIREQRAQAQAQQQAAATAVQAAESAKTLSETDTSGKNALTDLTGYS